MIRGRGVEWGKIKGGGYEIFGLYIDVQFRGGFCFYLLEQIFYFFA